MNSYRNDMVFPWVTIIEKYRQDRESNRHFTKRMGCNHTIIQAWKGGKIPSQKTINMIRDKLGMSYEDYKELTWVCHNVIPAEPESATRSEASLDAGNLPWTFFCRRLFSLKERGQSVAAFLDEFRISPARWREMMTVKSPQLGLEEMSSILAHPKVANNDKIIVMILLGTSEPDFRPETEKLEEVEDSRHAKVKKRKGPVGKV